MPNCIKKPLLSDPTCLKRSTCKKQIELSIKCKTIDVYLMMCVMINCVFFPIAGSFPL
jgi:hypothetical protein